MSNKLDARVVGFENSSTMKNNPNHFRLLLGDDFRERILEDTKDRDLDGIVPEDIFLREMKRLWKGMNNHYTKKFEECWLGILECLNNSMKETKMYVSTATMGAGKTTTAALYIAIYSVLYPSNGALMVCRRKAECIELGDALNCLLGDGTAFALHSAVSSKEKWKSNLETYQVLLATHIRFLGSNTIKTNSNFTRFRGSQRQLTIVDESLDFVTRHTLTKSHIKDILDRIGCYEKQYEIMLSLPKEISYLHIISKKLDDYSFSTGNLVEGVFEGAFDSNADALILDDNGNRIIQELELGPLIEKISSTAAEDWDSKTIQKKYNESGEDYDFFEFQSKLVHDILSIQSIVNLQMWASSDGVKGRRFSSGEIMRVIRKIIGIERSTQSCVVLDGTSHIDLTYKFLKESFPSMVHIQDKIEGIRDYGNVEFYVRSEVSGTGKTASIQKGRMEDRIEKILNWADEEFASRKDKVIFCATKKFCEQLQTAASKRKLKYVPEFIHYGCIDGRNDLKEFNNMVFLSIPNPPQDYHEQTIIAMNLGDKYLQKDERRKFVEANDASYIAVKLNQAIGRDIKRVVKQQGTCSKCRVYMMFQGRTTARNASFERTFASMQKKYQLVIPLIQSTFENSQWNTWSTFSGWNDAKAGKKRPEVVNTIIDYLSKSLDKGTSVVLTDLIFRLGISNDKDIRALKEYVRPARRIKNGFESDLSDIGVEIFSTQGRYGYTMFSKN